MTPEKEDLENFLDACDDLKERGYSDDGVAYAMGFNNTKTFKAFRAIIEKNLRAMERIEKGTEQWTGPSG